MMTKGTTPERIILFNGRIIVISQVKGEQSLYRVISDGNFKGYIQLREGEFYRLDGSSISDNKFEAICKALSTNEN